MSVCWVSSAAQQTVLRQASRASTPGPAGVAHDRGAQPARRALRGVQGRDVCELLERGHARDASAPAQRVHRRVVDRARPRCGCAPHARGLRVPGLQQQHRLARVASCATRIRAARVGADPPGAARRRSSRRLGARRPAAPPARRRARRRAWPAPRRPSPRRSSISTSPAAQRPDWATTATRPARGDLGRNDASSRTDRSVLTRPMQLGPSSRTPASRHSSRSRSSPLGAPGAAACPKPAVSTRSAPTPGASRSRTTGSTSAAGTATTARSMAAGRSSHRAVRRHRVHRVARAVDDVQRPGEPRLTQVRHHLVAHAVCVGVPHRPPPRTAARAGAPVTARCSPGSRRPAAETPRVVLQGDAEGHGVGVGRAPRGRDRCRAAPAPSARSRRARGRSRRRDPAHGPGPRGPRAAACRCRGAGARRPRACPPRPRRRQGVARRHRHELARHRATTASRVRRGSMQLARRTPRPPGAPRPRNRWYRWAIGRPLEQVDELLAGRPPPPADLEGHAV